MYSRRPGARFNRGRIATAAAASSTPISILGSLAWWVRADLGITIGTGVSAWADQSGNGVNFAQGTGSAQPAFGATAGPNNTPAVTGDGTNDILSATWSRVAPGTQPFYVWHVLKQVTWTNGRILYGDINGGVGFAAQQLTGTPNISVSINAVQENPNAAGTVGSFFRHELYFNNTTGSYHKIGSTNSTGGSTTNAAGSGTMYLFGFGGGAYSNIAIAESFVFLGTPSAQQRAALDEYCTQRYGAGLV